MIGMKLSGEDLHLEELFGEKEYDVEEVEDSGSDVEEDEFMEQDDCCGAAEFQAASSGNQSGSTNSSNQQSSLLLASPSLKALRA